MISSEDPLVKFMYVLLRDHMTSGTVEQIMTGHTEHPTAPSLVVFSDDFLAAKAVELALRLRGESRETACEIAHETLQHHKWLGPVKGGQ